MAKVVVTQPIPGSLVELWQTVLGPGDEEENGGNPFTDLPQVVVTPHIAGISQASVEQITRMSIANVARFLSGKPPEHLVPGQS